MASLFDLGGLGKDQAELLDLLDSVQLAGVGEGILPQIVVVGDQSSGKSSVLTRLTGIEFPRSQYACTKFATEIRLRRSGEHPDDRIRAWILPDKTAARSDRQRQAVEDFNQEIVETPENIAKVMQDATNLIAPAPESSSGNGPKFSSKDKLIIQKTGPSLPALTLVDLPGLVQLDNEKQSPQDLRLIEELTDSYIQDPASIILAVVSGAQQYSQARILKKITQWDPSGARTMGLLTKPDAADQACYTDEFIRLMTRRDANTKYHFRLGWHVLLNPDAFSNPSMAERNSREAQYWLGRRWAKLPDYMRGADALRVRLSRQLQKEIGRQLPAIQERLQKWEENCDAAINKLGPVLLTDKDKAKELGRLFSLSHQLIQQAVYGHLVNPPKMHFFPDTFDPRGIPAQHLRAKAVAESDAFEESFRQLGLKCRFTDKTGKVDVKAKRDFARNVVQPLLPQIRGRELPGDPNTRAPYMVFRRYSRQWFQLAKDYERKIEAACATFLVELKESAWPSRMREPLEMHHLRKRYGELLTAARAELEQVNQETFAMEIQPFDKEYEKCIADAIRISDGAGARVMSDAEKVVEQMLAYYMLAERIFIRNVIYQVAERHLLSGMTRLFNTEEVMGMSDETIDKITLEDPDSQSRRRALEGEKERIEEARRKCDAVAAKTNSRSDSENLPMAELDDDADDDDDAYHELGDNIPNTSSGARSDDGDSGNNDGAGYRVSERKEEDGRDEGLGASVETEQEALEQEMIEQRLEQERLEQERLEQERVEQDRLEQERLEQERLEQERLEQQRLEQERVELQRRRAQEIEDERRKAEEERTREMQRLAEEEHRRLELERMEREEELRRQREQDRFEEERLEQERNLELERQKKAEDDHAAAVAAEAALERLEALERETRRLQKERWKEEDRQARRLEIQRREFERRRVESTENELREARRAEARLRRLERRAARREEAKRLDEERQKAVEELRNARGGAPVELPDSPPVEHRLRHFQDIDDDSDVHERADAIYPPYAQSQSFPRHEVRHIDLGERPSLAPSSSPDTEGYSAPVSNTYTQSFLSSPAPPATPSWSLNMTPNAQSVPSAEEKYQTPARHLYSQQDRFKTPTQRLSRPNEDVETVPNMPGYFPTDDREYHDDLDSAGATLESNTTWATAQPRHFGRPTGGVDVQLRDPESADRLRNTDARAPGNTSTQTQGTPGPYYSRASTSTQSRGSTSSSLVDSGYHVHSSSGSGSGNSGSKNKRSSAFGKLFGSRR